jgi:hypothetical protein
MKTRVWILLPALLLAACAAHHPAAPIAPPDPATPTAGQIPTTPGKFQQVIFVNMYEFTVPYGTISHDPTFWKDVDETALDLTTYDLLLRNGIRVGRAPLGAWTNLALAIDREVTMYRTHRFTTFSGGDSLSVPMSPEMDDQLLFTLTSHGMAGRWYDFCQNRFDFSFQWERHVEDTVRVNICPLVVVHRMRWDYFLADTPEERRLVQDDYLWDLAIKADLTRNDFLVIAPSPEAQDPYRVGNKFLTNDGSTYRTEQILILARSPLIINRAKATTAPVAPLMTK